MSRWLPEGYRIEYVEIYSGTGLGDDRWAWQLQVYGRRVKRRLLRSDIITEGWQPLETVAYLTRASMQKLARTAYQHATIRKGRS